MQIVRQSFLLIFCSFVFAEVCTRCLSSFWPVFDIEMIKYSRDLKSYDLKEGSFRHKKNIKTQLMSVPVTINKDGFRTYNEVNELESKKSEKKIFFMGDSLTFGWGVDYNQTFTGLAQNDHINANIRNMGHCNYNLEQSVVLLKKYAQVEIPKIVYLFYYINDAEKKNIKPNISWYFRSEFISLIHSRFRIFFNQQDYVGYYKNLYQPKSSTWINLKKQFLYLKELSISYKFKLRIVILPDFRDLKNYPFHEEHDMVISYLRGHQIEAIDLIDEFPEVLESKGLWVSSDDPHPNKKGHEMIYQSFREILREDVVGLDDKTI